MKQIVNKKLQSFFKEKFIILKKVLEEQVSLIKNQEVSTDLDFVDFEELSKEFDIDLESNIFCHKIIRYLRTSFYDFLLNMLNNHKNIIYDVDLLSIEYNFDDIIEKNYNKLKDKCFMGSFEEKELNNYFDNNINFTWGTIKNIHKEQDEITKRAFMPEKIINEI